MKNLTIYFGEMQKSLELWTRKAVECLRKHSMGCSNRIQEGSAAGGDVYCRGPVEEISE